MVGGGEKVSAGLTAVPHVIRGFKIDPSAVQLLLLWHCSKPQQCEKKYPWDVREFELLRSCGSLSGPKSDTLEMGIQNNAVTLA